MDVLGAIGTGVNLVSGILGASSNKKAQKLANEANLKIAQMNRDFNEQEAQKTRDWQEQMYARQLADNRQNWQMEADWNSAASQRQRLEEAGLNPYLMMNGGNAGTAGSVTSATAGQGAAASAGNAPQMQAARFDYSGISSAINSFFQNQLLASQSSSVDVNTGLTRLYGDDLNKATIAAQIGGNYEWLTQDYRNFRQRYGEDMARLGISNQGLQNTALRLNNEMTLANTAFTTLKAESQRTLNKYLDQQQQSDLMVKGAQIFSMHNAGLLSLNKARTELYNQIKISAETEGIRINNRIARETADDLIESLNISNKYNSIYGRASIPYAPYLARSRAEMEQAQRDMLLNELGIKSGAIYKWMHKNVTPITSSIGSLLGGAAAGAIGSKLFHKAPRPAGFRY